MAEGFSVHEQGARGHDEAKHVIACCNTSTHVRENCAHLRSGNHVIWRKVLNRERTDALRRLIKLCKS